MGKDVSELARLPIDIPAEAVADAMMVAQAEMVLGVTAYDNSLSPNGRLKDRLANYIQT